ncbi:hypothetical protein [Aeromonas salmonicida]
MLQDNVEATNKSATYRVIQKRLSLALMASQLLCKMGKIPALSQNHRNLIAPFFPLNLRLCVELAINTPKWVMVFMFKNGLEILMSGQGNSALLTDTRRSPKTFVNC